MIVVHRMTMSSNSQERGIGVLGALLVLVLIVVIALVALLVIPRALGFVRGSRFDVGQAQRVVADQRPLLGQVLALARQTPLPPADDPNCVRLAEELGALEIRFEKDDHGSRAIIVYHIYGLPEHYENQLVWVPEQTAARVREGKVLLGEAFEYVDRGWWWVWW